MTKCPRKVHFINWSTDANIYKSRILCEFTEAVWDKSGHMLPLAEDKVLKSSPMLRLLIRNSSNQSLSPSMEFRIAFSS
jgi:hypothetical protein